MDPLEYNTSPTDQKISSMLKFLHTNKMNEFTRVYHEIYTNPPDKYSVYKDFQQIPGLWYVPNYLSETEINLINQQLTQTNFVPVISFNPHSRRVAHFGYKYAYDRSGTILADPIPTILADLVSTSRINLIIGQNLITEPFDQLIINEYKPDQQIAPHTDHTTQFGDVIACLTVGQSVPLIFSRGSLKKKINANIGSLYIMTSDARYKWKHSLRNNSDNVRYSLTYRNIKT